MEASAVSLQAFQEEVANWQLTLTREAKKLKQLRAISGNRFQLNSIDITLVEIESQLIQYKRIKDKNFSSSVALIEHYSSLSKRFMAIMEKIGEAVEQDRFKDTSPPQEIENINPNTTHKPKHFLQETFNHKVSKQPSRKKAKSTITTAKQLSQVLRKESKQVKGGKLTKGVKGWQLRGLQEEADQDLSDIRYQLKEIKSMMVQIESEIKFHSHQEVQRQVDRLSHASRKLTNQLKTLRDDNHFVLARLQAIKEEIAHEKHVQTEMIKQFQLGREGKVTISELAKSKNTADEVSQWVRVRI